MKRLLTAMLAAGALGLLAASLFVQARPDLFYEMMVIIGAPLAGVIAGVTTVVAALLARWLFKVDLRALISAPVSSLVAGAGSFLWAIQHQMEILEQIRERI